MATDKKDPAENLEDFSFDESGTQDFFNIGKEDVEDQKEDIEDVDDAEEEDLDKKEDPKEDSKEDSKEDPKGGDDKEDEDNMSFFDEPEEDSPLNEKNHYAKIFKDMKEKGLMSGDLPEDEDLTEDKFFELQDQEIENRVEETLKGFMSELDDDGAAFLKFKKSGGSTEDFLKAYSESTNLPSGDIEDEKYQEKISRYFYKNVEDLEEEDIEDRIEWLKDSGKLKKYAEKHDKEVKEADKERKELLQEEAKRIEKEKEKQRKQFVDNINEAIENIDKIDNFAFAKDDKSKLKPFITKANVKKADGKGYMTGMQAKLQEALNSPEGILKLAKVLESDFNLESLAASSVTKKTKQIKDDVRRAKNSNRPSGSGRTKSKRSLADMFN